MNQFEINAEPGSYKWSGTTAKVLALRGYELDPAGPFYRFVLTYLVASAGLTPVYDETHYPDFLRNIAGVFPGDQIGNAQVDLAECVQQARNGELSQRETEISLCCMLANLAYESIEESDREAIVGHPVFEVLRHVRNAASHGNRWWFNSHEPSRRGEWVKIVIDEKLKGAANPRHLMNCVYGDLQPADLLFLLRDVEMLLKSAK